MYPLLLIINVNIFYCLTPPFYGVKLQDDECGARMALIATFKLSGNIDSIELRIESLPS
jgi:hypothetical protein